MAGLPEGMIDRGAYSARPEHSIIGLMSGTSLDGVDAVLTRIMTEPEGPILSVSLIAHSYLPYSDEMRTRISALCSVETARLDDLVYAHFGLGEWYAKAVQDLLARAGRTASSIDAVCMHGQTIWHAPEARPFPGPEGFLPVKGTLQIGASAVLRERTGIPVISDLRSRDMAAGGEGAPLAPFVDAILFGSPKLGRIVQNIGGIGNATVVPPAAAAADLLAFDTGPGNMLMDAVVLSGSGGRHRYDPEGSMAAKGKVHEGIVERLMLDPYFRREPPKSTGREVYGADFAAAFMEEARERGLSFEDQVATATAFTAESIARSYKDFILPRIRIDEVLACGGGARNPSLLAMIRDRLPAGILVITSSERGVPDEAREAMAFAVMGHESLMGRPGNLPAVTGARAPVVLGNLTL
jgi:anhydro-N-acetylmuramic acid kinase